MKTRVLTSSNNRYERYGGRGIDICDRWLEKDGQGFLNFLADMGEAPEGYTLDRIDNNKGYYPDNCRWATQKEQGNNRSNNVFLTYKGETLTIAQWAEKTGIPHDTIRTRNQKGWSAEKIFETPVNKLKPIHWKGESMLLNHWAKKLGIRQSVLWNRLYVKHWDVDKAFSTPVQKQRQSSRRSPQTR